MKKKVKKLRLSTETLRTLGEPALKDAAGGATFLPCESNATRACTFCTAVCTICCP